MSAVNIVMKFEMLARSDEAGVAGEVTMSAYEGFVLFADSQSSFLAGERIESLLHVASLKAVRQAALAGRNRDSPYA